MKRLFIFMSLLLGFCFGTPEVAHAQSFVTPKVVKEVNLAKNKGMDASTTNKPELRAYQFAYEESVANYILFGGMNLYTSTYKKNIPDGLLKITVQDPGTMMLTASELTKNSPYINVYNKNKYRIGVMMEGMLKANVKKGDVFYLEMPKKVDQLVIYIVVLKDHHTILKNHRSMIQSGTGKNEYRTFRMEKRGNISVELMPCEKDELGGTFYLQKREKGKWRTVGKQVKANISQFANNNFFAYGLRAGSYRFVSKIHKDDLYEMRCDSKEIKKTYKTSKKSAKLIKSGKVVEDIYTTTEKKARWYKIKRTTIRKKKQYIYVFTEANQGKFKISIYKKGIRKPLKTKILKGSVHKEAELRYYPKKGVGTYYVKAEKIGASTNGYYCIENGCK